MKIVNLTPHAITLRADDGSDTVIQPEPIPARVASEPGERLPGVSTPVPVYRAPTWGEIEGLPTPVEGVLYIVSGIVAGRCSGRSDVVSPGTGPADNAVRDDAGRIVAVTRLIAAPGP